MATNLRPSIRSLITVAAMTLGAASAVYADAAAPTFSADVAPLMSRYCVSCHQPDGAAPFSLLTHASVRQHATQIVAALSSGYMPPWKSEPGYGEFVGQPRPTAAEVDLIRRWVAAGAPEGDRAFPIVPAGKGGWRLGTPDAIVRPPAPYVLPA